MSKAYGSASIFDYEKKESFNRFVASCFLCLMNRERIYKVSLIGEKIHSLYKIQGKARLHMNLSRQKYLFELFCKTSRILPVGNRFYFTFTYRALQTCIGDNES